MNQDIFYQNVLNNQVLSVFDNVSIVQNPQTELYEVDWGNLTGDQIATILNTLPFNVLISPSRLDPYIPPSHLDFSTDPYSVLVSDGSKIGEWLRIDTESNFSLYFPVDIINKDRIVKHTADVYKLFISHKTDGNIYGEINTTNQSDLIQEYSIGADRLLMGTASRFLISDLTSHVGYEEKILLTDLQEESKKNYYAICEKSDSSGYELALINENHLDTTNSPSDTEILKYNQASNKLTWIDEPSTTTLNHPISDINALNSNPSNSYNFLKYMVVGGWKFEQYIKDNDFANFTLNIVNKCIGSNAGRILMTYDDAGTVKITENTFLPTGEIDSSSSVEYDLLISNGGTYGFTVGKLSNSSITDDSIYLKKIKQDTTNSYMDSIASYRGQGYSTYWSYNIIPWFSATETGFGSTYQSSVEITNTSVSYCNASAEELFHFVNSYASTLVSYVYASDGLIYSYSDKERKKNILEKPVDMSHYFRIINEPLYTYETELGDIELGLLGNGPEIDNFKYISGFYQEMPSVAPFEQEFNNFTDDKRKPFICYSKIGLYLWLALESQYKYVITPMEEEIQQLKIKEKIETNEIEYLSSEIRDIKAQLTELMEQYKSIPVSPASSNHSSEIEFIE